MIELDGAMGEGGGQILRSALTLSMITGQPFQVRRIRANRARPGLMRQHLVAVRAAARICEAEVTGAEVGSQLLTFIPQSIRGGDYTFAIGTAGSCTLVLQTLLPALLQADTTSVLRISGGTHNPMAPPAQFLQRAYARVLTEMGAAIDIRLERFGFYPAGGGELVARIQPCAQLRRIALLSRGACKAAFAESFVAGLPLHVADRELACVAAALGWDVSRLRVRQLRDTQGPGNALLITLEYEQVTEVFSAIGEKTLRAEEVARRALQQVRHYLASSAVAGEHLADQLMLPMALAGGGSFSMTHVSMHASTNARVIERFLPVSVTFDQGHGDCTCTIANR